MKRLLSVFVLCAAVCFGQSKPQVEVVPKPKISVRWFNTVDPDLFFMLEHATAVFSVLHDQDMRYCENGPSDPEQSPTVKRCDGAI